MNVCMSHNCDDYKKVYIGKNSSAKVASQSCQSYFWFAHTKVYIDDNMTLYYIIIIVRVFGRYGINFKLYIFY